MTDDECRGSPVVSGVLVFVVVLWFVAWCVLLVLIGRAL